MEKILPVDTGERNLDGHVQFVDVVLLSAMYLPWEISKINPLLLLSFLVTLATGLVLLAVNHPQARGWVNTLLNLCMCCAR